MGCLLDPFDARGFSASRLSPIIMQLTRRLTTYLIASDRPFSVAGGCALFISMAGSPFLTPLYTAGIVVGTLVDNRQQLLVWGSLNAVFLIGVALGYVVIQVWRGKISDFH